MANEFWNNFNAGYGAASEMRQRSALGRMQHDRQGGLNALMAVNPELAMRYEDRQAVDDMRSAQRRAGGFAANGDYKGAMQASYGNGDFEAGHYFEQVMRQASEADKQALKEKVQFAGTVAYGLRGMPVEQRQAWLQQNAGMIAARGGDVSTIDPAHLDDTSLDQVIADAAGLDRLMDYHQALAQERQADARLAISQGQLEARQYGQTHGRR